MWGLLKKHYKENPCYTTGVMESRPEVHPKSSIPLVRVHPRQASRVVTELKRTEGLVPNLLEKNRGNLVEHGITGGVWGEELRLESEKATKLC